MIVRADESATNLLVATYGLTAHDLWPDHLADRVADRIPVGDDGAGRDL